MNRSKKLKYGLNSDGYNVLRTSEMKRVQKNKLFNLIFFLGPRNLPWFFNCYQAGFESKKAVPGCPQVFEDILFCLGGGIFKVSLPISAAENNKDILANFINFTGKFIPRHSRQGSVCDD
jgi:hypothetical protein